MRTHREIAKAAGEDRLVELCGVSVHTARSWIQRDRIPSDQWKALADASVASLVELASHAAANPRTRSTSAQPEQVAA